MALMYKVNGVEFSEDQFAVVRKGLPDGMTVEVVQKNDPASTTLTGTPLHGPYPGNNAQFGVFSTSGVRPDRYSAVPRVRSLSRVLPLVSSEFYNESYDIVTGVTAGSGSNPTSFCGNPALAGQFKTTTITKKFGKFYLGTKLQAIPEIGLLRDRADQVGRVLNEGPHENKFVPDLLFRMTDPRDVFAQEMVQMGFEAERSHELTLITGNNSQSNTLTDRGFIAEYDGLDQWVNASYSAPAANSIVETYNANITGTTSDGRSFAEMLSDTYFALKDRAAQMFGEGAVRWGIAARRDTHRAMTNVLSYQYATAWLAGSSTFTQTQDALVTTQFRDDMLNNQYIRIEGDNVEVIYCDGIPRETLANATYKSDIYFVPLSWNGTPLTYIQYFPQNNPYSVAYRTAAGFKPDNQFVTDNGLYLIGSRETPMCMEYQIAGMMRLIMDVPYLAARVDDVWYNFRAQIRDPYPSDSFYADGGRTYVS